MPNRTWTSRAKAQVVVGPAASDNLWFWIQTATVMDTLHTMRWVHHWGPPAVDHLFEYSYTPQGERYRGLSGLS